MRRHIYHIMAVNVATEDDDARHKLGGGDSQDCGRRELATPVVLLKLERGIANVVQLLDPVNKTMMLNCYYSTSGDRTEW